MKKVRFILPAVAIIFAIAGTFGTMASPKSAPFIPVTDVSSSCQKIGDCDEGVTGQTCAQSAGKSALYQVAATCPSYSTQAKFIPL